MKSAATSFLTAEWRHLAMLNYEIDPRLLAPFIPKGTELDQWQGRIFVSIVGFLFLNTKISGISVPFHSSFEEVNLRFYVKRLSEDGWRRGVVFIKELVPRRAIAWTARILYNENYIALPMSHKILLGETGSFGGVSHEWLFNGGRNRMEIFTQGDATAVQIDSQEEFITEHYWGYARQRDGAPSNTKWSILDGESGLFDPFV